MSSRPIDFNVLTDYPRIKIVHSFKELVETPFNAGINALCWKRTLPGDFAEVVDKISPTEDIATLNDEVLQALLLTPAGRTAVDIILLDLKGLRALGLSPVLDCIRQYPRDESEATVPTDVYSFHVDSAEIEADTFLCTYSGAPSEGLRNEESREYAEIPEIRAKLLKDFGGADDEKFREYLRENCYDLHFAPIEAARPFSFGVGNFWRIAVKYPGCPVPPCVHRAPETLPGSLPRLLLIS